MGRALAASRDFIPELPKNAAARAVLSNDIGCCVAIDRLVAAVGPANYMVQVLVSDWLIIDGTMDNHVHAIIDGAVSDGMQQDEDALADDRRDGTGQEDGASWTEEDADDLWDASLGSGTEAAPATVGLPRLAELCFSIRRAGWEQIAGWSHDAEGDQTWPTAGQMATITLAGAQWSLVVFALNYWADVAEQLDALTAAKSRVIVAEIEQQLAEQGWSGKATWL